MKFGVREICDVVLKAKAAQKVGNKLFYKNEPVIYFDTLKTSTMEGAATTVYAQGGRGNSRLMAWEGERTITFTMEDALISPAGFMILSGAGLVDAGNLKADGTKETMKVHTTEQTDAVNVDDAGNVVVTVESRPYFVPADKDVAEDLSTAFNGDYKNEAELDAAVFAVLSAGEVAIEPSEDYIYVMLLDNGEVVTEPYIPVSVKAENISKTDVPQYVYHLTLNNAAEGKGDDVNVFTNGCVALVDYYVEKAMGAQQIDITPDKFGGNYYLEASTLFRDTNGVDMPAEFVIPNCKIQSNFTFTMASSGDPSTFTFTMDAFPDYTRFDKTKKVLAAIQIVDVAGSSDISRDRTASKQHSYFN